MKRNVITLSLAALVACGGALLSGCGGGGGDHKTTTVEPTREALIGSWRYQSLQRTSGGAAVTCPGGYSSGTPNDYEAYCGSADSLTLNADNTYTSHTTKLDGFTGVNTAGTWSLSNGLLTLTQSTSNTLVSDTTSISMSSDLKSFTLNDTAFKTVLTKL